MRKIIVALLAVVLLSSGSFAGTDYQGNYVPSPTNITLLSGATAITDGTWVSVKGLQGLTVQVKGVTSATVVINVSADPTQPANSVHDLQAMTCTADCGHLVKGNWRWLKVRIPTYSSGTINAYLEAK